jgi:hypothetical protein
MFFVEDLGYLIKILNFCYLGQGQITLEKYTSLKLQKHSFYILFSEHAQIFK